MKFLKASFQNIIWWTGVIFVGIIFGVSLQFASAWVAPPANPPGASVGAPINTANVLQRKLGTLITGGLATSVFKLYTGAGAGKVLTSDASGLASWQNPGNSVSGRVVGGFTESGGIIAGEPWGDAGKSCSGRTGGNPCVGVCPSGSDKVEVFSHTDSYSCEDHNICTTQSTLYLCVTN